MNSLLHARHSLKTRITLGTLTIFVISIWALDFYASRMLRGDMEKMVGDQQFSSVSILSADINDELQDRLNALETIAKEIDAGLMARPTDLQARLDQRPLLLPLFNGGFFLVNKDGTAIADVPLSTNRIGINYMDRDHVAVPLKEGKSMVSRPVMDKAFKAPVFAMVVPVRDAQGKTIGALIGVINLSKPSFLDRVTNNQFGKTGDYLLVAPQHGLVVTASDKKRIMEMLPAPGVSAIIDRRSQGHEGTEVFLNPVGVEVLSSAKGLPVAGWYVAVTLPTSDAFATIHAMEQRMLIAAILLTLIAGSLTWWMLRRQLAPMTDAASLLSRMADSDQPPQALPVVSHDEIGALVGGVNHLLKTLEHRGAALAESEERLKNLVDASSEWVWEVDCNGVYTYASPKVTELLGYLPEEIIGKTPFDLMPPEEAERVGVEFAKLAAERAPLRNLENTNRHKDGRIVMLETSGFAMVDAQGNFAGYRGMDRDITERKQAETALQASLQEKTALLMEVHHRVKNNLQVIASLLRMEARRSQQADTQAVLADMQGRIRSMALLHKALYRSGTFASVDLGNYLQKVASQAFDSQSLAPDLVRLTLRLGSVQVGMDQAIAAGLMANELISNSLKHGFPQAHSGEVSVTLQPVDSATQVTDPQWRLCVSDTGVGLPADFDARCKTSLGLQLVNSLSQQIGGSLGIDSPPGQGAQFTVIFTALEPQSLVMPV